MYFWTIRLILSHSVTYIDILRRIDITYVHGTHLVVDIGGGASLINLQRKEASCDALKKSATLLQAES